MGHTLRLLIVEDSKDDTLLIQRELRRSGYEITSRRVDNAPDMCAALQQQAWDIITSDQSMPEFNATAALAVLQESGLDIPFIVISGEADLNLAVSLIRSGAQDFIQKQELARLPLAIGRELEKAENRRRRQQAEAALRASEARFRQLIEDAPIGISTARRGQMLYANPAYLEMFGYQQVEEIRGLTLASQFAPQARAVALDRNRRRELGEQVVSEYNTLGLRKDGSIFPVNINASVIHLPDGRATLAFVRDLTERWQAEEAQSESENRWRDMLENAHLMAVMLDRSGQVVFCNDYLLQLTGWSRPDVLGVNWFEHFVPPEERVQEAFDNFMAQDTIFPSFEHHILTRSSERRWTSWRNTVRRDAQGNVIGITSIGEDTTERKRAQEEIIRLNAELEQRVRQRTAQLEVVNKELEAFTYSVSHDLRAPLWAVTGFTRALREVCAGRLDDECENDLRYIEESVGRMSEMINGLLALSRCGREEIDLQVVDLSDLARSIAVGLSQQDPTRTVEWVIDGGLRARADPRLARMALNNLLSNAWKFSTRQPAARVEFGAQTRPDGERVFFVRDNGAGFDPAQSDKLFAIFQRLHSEQEFPGTGVGLVLVQRIILRHGGQVWAEGAPGAGATFYFTLPRE